MSGSIGWKKEKMKEEKSWAAEFTNGIDQKWCSYNKLLMYKGRGGGRRFFEENQ